MSASVVSLDKYREKKSREWGVYEFYWGAAVRNERTRQWTQILLKPDGQEINVEHLAVILHENGIEFMGGERVGY
jgi:hypothetical protein